MYPVLCFIFLTIVVGMTKVLAAEPKVEPGSAGGLQLVASDGKQEWRDFSAENGTILLRNGQGTRRATENVAWRLEGDLKRNAAFFEFSPNYRLIERAGPTGVTSVAIVWTKGSQWVNKGEKNSIVVCVWVVDGKVEMVVPIATNTDDRDDAAIHALELGPRMKQGFPLVLWLSPRGFLMPNPLFADRQAQRVVEVMHFGALDELKHETSQLRSVNVGTVNGDFTLLHIAAEAGFAAATEVLLREGAKTNLESRGRERAIDWAASKGRGSTVQSLVNHSPHSRTSIDANLVLETAKRGHIDLAAELWRISPDRKTDDFISVAARRHRIDLLNTIVTEPGDKSCAHVSPVEMESAILQNRGDFLKFILERGARPNELLFGCPLLVVAAESGNPAMIEALLRSGAKPSVGTPEGSTPLMVAAYRGPVESVRLLLAANAKATAQTKQGMTALHYAALAGNVDIVAALLKTDAKVNERDAAGQTPLEIVLASRQRAIVSMLVTAGASLAEKNSKFNEAIVHALALDQAELLKRAVAMGWNPDKPIFESLTATDLSEVFDGQESRAYLKSISKNSSGKFSLEKKPEKLARPVGGSRPLDPRPWDSAQPAVAVEVSGVVDDRGRFLFPKIGKGGDDPLLVGAIFSVLPSWKFEPGRKNGRPVNTELTLSLNFSARSSRIFGADEVDAKPMVSTKAKLAPSSDRSYQMETSTIIQEVMVRSPPVYRTVFSPLERVLPTGENRLGEWALFTAVVEPNGSVDKIAWFDASDGLFLQAASSAFKKYRFEPGLKNRAPVRTRITYLIRPDAK